MKIMLVAGGTGGHFFPAVSLIPYLKKKYDSLQLFFVLGTKNIEDRFLPHIPEDILISRVRGSYWSWKKISRIFDVLINCFQSLLLLIKKRPRIIILFGGYLSLFPGIWGKLLGSRIILHEQNVIPGKVNQLLSLLADEIWGTFKESKPYFKCQYKFKCSGIPIRKSFPSLPLEEFHYCRAKNKKTILFLGGSQGALFLNQLFFSLIEQNAWNSSFYSILVGGIKEKTRKEESFCIIPFWDDIFQLYSIADLAVTRAGASTIAELLNVRLKGILIPYPYAYRKHQWYNALAAQELSGNNLLYYKQQDIDVGSFTETVQRQLQANNLWKSDLTFKQNVLDKLG